MPVTPDKLQIKINSNNDTVNLIDEGEINLLKKPGLTEVEFECDIPQVQHPYAVYASGFKSADYFLDYFEQLKTSQKPFQFIVCRQMPSGKKLFNTNIKVAMENYRITEDVKEGFDLVVKISLKQYRDYGTKTVDITVQDSETTVSVVSSRETINSPSPDTPQSYTVVSGDTLWNIAKKFYGDGLKYTVIYEANKDAVDSNSGVVPGQILTIPVV